jgi:O-antigen/teichoic acid export membrane protein
LLYFRLAVRGFNPETYGLASAWIGAHQLLRGVLVLPLLQLLLFRFHSQEAQDSGIAFSTRLFQTLLLACILLTTAAGVGLRLFPPTSQQWILGGAMVGLLGLTEALKGFSLNHLNLQERHGTYAIAMLGDSLLRLLLLFIALPFGPTKPAVLLGVPVLASSFAMLLIGWRHIPRGRTTISLKQLIFNNYHFIIPVAGFAIASWSTGFSDRYFLLRWAGERETGLYAAVYGLFGTPFPLLVAALTQVFRPRLSRLHAGVGNESAYSRAYRNYFAFGVGGAAILALGLWSARHEIANLMLRSEHLSILRGLPWLLGGQVAMVLGLLFELEFFVKNQIRFVTVKQCAGMAAALGAMAFLIPRAGAQGAMVACTIYYSVDCLTAAALWLRATHRKGISA